MRSLDENSMYAILRYSLIAQFANEDFRERYDLDISHFDLIYKFIKGLYYEHCKSRINAQSLRKDNL